MGRIPHRVCAVCPFPWHTECATSDDRQTQVVALLPLL